MSRKDIYSWFEIMLLQLLKNGLICQFVLSTNITNQPSLRPINVYTFYLKW